MTELMKALLDISRTEEHAMAASHDDQWRMHMIAAFSHTPLDEYLQLMEELTYRSEAARKAEDDIEDMVNTLAMIGWQYVTNELIYQVTQDQERESNDGV
jgi:hypothetical protein